MNKHTVTVNGRTLKRNSAGRVYTHVVVGINRSKGTWEAFSWAGSEQLAEKAARRWAGYTPVKVLPVGAVVELATPADRKEQLAELDKLVGHETDLPARMQPE